MGELKLGYVCYVCMALWVLIKYSVLQHGCLAHDIHNMASEVNPKTHA